MRSRVAFLVLATLAAIAIAFGVRAGASRADNDDRVAEARKRIGPDVREAFAKAGIAYPPRALYLRVLKRENRLEMWGEGASGRYALVRSYPVCAASGTLGPKRTEGDEQVPEGLYEVRIYNAKSRYHLSLGIDYPNASDRVRGKAPFGGDIMIHGGCVTIGCVPLGDDAIDEVFLAALDTHVAGRPVRVHLFPTAMTDADVAAIEREAAAPTVELWRSLRPAYERFERTRTLPRARVDGRTGLYLFDD
jgi:murein L,D-transpeptidase YafK